MKNILISLLGAAIIFLLVQFVFKVNNPMAVKIIISLLGGFSYPVFLMIFKGKNLNQK